MKHSLPEADILFEQHSIDEILELEKKLKADIEKKKEDIRQMVGERYRDLLEAADTITSMKINATTVVQHMTHLQSECSTLKSLELANTNKCQADPSNLNELRIAQQVKFLVDTPTKIWNYIDQKHFLESGIVYLAARHTHVSLLLSPGVYAKFPILKSHWPVIQSTLPQVLQACKKFLENESQDIQAISDTLCCLLLLNETTIKALFQEFIDIRKASVLKILLSDKPGSFAKNQICQSLSLILNTLQVIAAVFREPSLLIAKLKLLQNKESLELPKETPTFVPSYSSNVIELFEHTKLEKLCQDWLERLSADCQEVIGKLFGFITTCKSLSSVRQFALELLNKEAKVEIYPLSLKINLWNLFLNSAFISRIKCIMHINMESNLNQLLGSINMTSRQVDLAGFVWDLSGGHSKELLAMKTAGHALNIQRICNGLESRLKSLEEDLESLPSFHEEISSHMLVECEQFIVKLINHFQLKNDSQWNLFVYKLCLSLPQLSPSLFNSFFHKTEAKNQLLEVAEDSFKKWSKDFVKQLCQSLYRSPTADDILSSMQVWDKLEIKEEGGTTGESLKSTLLVPFQASQDLYSIMLCLIKQVNQAGAHCLIRKTIQVLSEDFVQELCNVYSQIQWPSNPHLAQTCALQTLFDLHFVGQLLGRTIDQEIISTIESQIDPFDLDVISTPLQNNIRLATHRSLLLFGLVSSPLTTLLPRPTASQEIHNLIPLNTDSPASKFQLLPITPQITSIQPTLPTKSKASSSIRSHGSSPNLTALPNSISSPSKSSSFYDRMTSAMASSWFS